MPWLLTSLSDLAADDLARVLGALGLDAVTDTADLERLGVTRGHAGDHVRHQRAGQAVKGLVLTLVVRAGDVENAVLALGDLDRRGDGVREGTLGALHGDRTAIDGDVHTGGNLDGELADSRHELSFLSRLPDVGEDFPTYALLACLLAGQETVGRGDDRHAQAAENLRQVGGLCVNTQTRLRDALDAGDRALAVRAELQLEDEVLADLGVLDLPAGDEALLLENLRDVRLDLAVRHHDGVVVRRVRVTQTREHVCDGISHGHELAFGLSRRGFLYAPSLSPLSGGTGAVRGPTA